MKVLVTGASGFVGRATVDYLCDRAQHQIFGTVRDPAQHADCRARLFRIEEIDAHTGWAEVLAGIDVIVHTAARVHVMRDSATDPVDAYRRVNVEGTLNLARQALQAGVKRFVFLSSIKVNGEMTLPGEPFRSTDLPNPVDPYGVSKLEAEQGLQRLCENTVMDWVIIRPPLVYGPGVKANFLSMMRWLRKGVPLPLSLVRNRRSLVARDNLVDLIATCVDSRAAGNKILLVSDGQDLSTAELLRVMGTSLGRPARLFPCPVWMLRSLANLVGKPAVAQRLLDSLQVDILDTRETLDWSPPVSVDDAMRKTADDFLQQAE